MTIKKFGFAEKVKLKELKTGDILKKSGDFFIVAETEGGKTNGDTITSANINQALYGNRGNTSSTSSSCRYARSAFNLISLQNGTRYFDENFVSLIYLFDKCIRIGFRPVKSIEIEELD